MRSSPMSGPFFNITQLGRRLRHTGQLARPGRLLWRRLLPFARGCTPRRQRPIDNRGHLRGQLLNGLGLRRRRRASPIPPTGDSILGSRTFSHMTEIFGDSLTLGNGLFLALALFLALSFEFVNGFHDTANAVATVIYTHSLRPTVAVIWSGLWNLIGVLTSSGSVAFSVLALLPVELVLNVGSGAGFAMVFGLLLAAIAWSLS